MSAVDDIVSYCISKRDGSRHKDNPAHMEKWDRAILACGGTHMDCKHPRRRSLGPMSLDEAESKASTLWGGRNWKPVADYLKQGSVTVSAEISTVSDTQTAVDEVVSYVDSKQQEDELSQYANSKKLVDGLMRKGSVQWRHENILRQIDGLPTWSRDEAKKYYNSIGHRQYAEPTHTRKGMFWMDFTTDDNGNVVQTEKPIARYSPKSDVIELQRIINDRDVEINNLLNKVDSNPTAVKVNELEGQIAHLKIQLDEAKDSYVDINNIPFGTAVQVLARGEFPEPEHGHKITVKEPDLTTLATYGRKLQNILVDCNRVLPLFGDKKNPSELCKAYNVSISDYGQPIYASKPEDELLNLIEFCRQMDIATDHTIQNLQATVYAIDKIIKESGQK